MNPRPCFLTAITSAVEAISKLSTPVGIAGSRFAVAVRAFADLITEASLVTTVTLKLFDAVIDRRAELMLVLSGGLSLLGSVITRKRRNRGAFSCPVLLVAGGCRAFRSGAGNRFCCGRC